MDREPGTESDGTADGRECRTAGDSADEDNESENDSEDERERATRTYLKLARGTPVDCARKTAIIDGILARYAPIRCCRGYKFKVIFPGS